MTRKLAVVMLVLSAFATPARPQEPIAPVWSLTEGIDTPESAYYDADSNSLFVSQVAGPPDRKDGVGWISRLDLEGKVIAARWVEGLNAPKGMRAHKGTLWVSDIDQVVAIDIAQARITRRVPVADARFLNDVAIGPDGTVYVSDMMLSRIYQVKGGNASVFAEGEDLEYPNGLLVDGGRLLVAAWGKPEADFSTRVPGRLFSLDLETKKKTLITRDPTGNLDGLELDGRGGFIVTDWIAGKVIHVAADGKTRTLLRLSQGTADHAYIPGRTLLVLPQMNENRVTAYDLSRVMK